MISRLLSTLVLWGVVFSGLWFFGGHAAVTMIALLTALTLYEFYGLTEKMGARPFRWMGILFSLLMIAGPYYVAYFFEDYYVSDALVTLLLVLALIVSCARVLGERNPSNRVETIASTLIGLLCIPFMLQYLVQILMREADSGENLVLCLWLVAVSKFCDVGALLTGLAIGRHKLAPEISPKKTWEGAVGGVIVSAGMGAAIAHFFPGHLPESLTPAVAALIALPLAVITILSDLIESAIKRRAGAKDTGAMIPGIGGAFDLTDSLILTAPVAYYIFLFLE